MSETTVFPVGIDLEYDSTDFDAEYTFTTTAQETVELELVWNWRFCHSFFQSDAEAYIFADIPNGEFEEQIRDSGGCIETETGTDTLDIYEGYDWAIRIVGSHFDSRNEISGRFAIDFTVYRC